MNNSNEESFLAFIKQLFVPIGILLYVATMLIQLKDSLEQLGYQIFSMLVAIFVLLWVAYVWKARVNENGSSNYKFNKKIRFGAVLAFLLSILPIIYVYEVQKTPNVYFEISNQSGSEINIKYLNHYSIQRIGDNGFPYIVDSGLINIYNTSKDTKNLTIGTEEKKKFYGVFIDKSKIKHFLLLHEYFIVLNLKLEEGGIVSSDKMLLLSRDGLKKTFLPLEAK